MYCLASMSTCSLLLLLSVDQRSLFESVDEARVVTTRIMLGLVEVMQGAGLAQTVPVKQGGKLQVSDFLNTNNAGQRARPKIEGDSNQAASFVACGNSEPRSKAEPRKTSAQACAQQRC